ncbi:hypothetical protein [Streptomyces sp. Root369]|uniref:hypothetical protein n=1 Tax=Streptomyces sp. Root369 TaxID=1736523 RepID=UPI00070E1049|nr:hypothetical protein [Streptomyces sp. Root369]KQV95237.1 hypothetical protein ASD08_12325 [Streptomyces sp. Root369]
MRTHDDGLILLAHRIPAQVTPVGEWLAEVADRVVLITSEEAGPGYAGQFGEVIPVADYSGSDAVIAPRGRPGRGAGRCLRLRACGGGSGAQGDHRSAPGGGLQPCAPSVARVAGLRAGGRPRESGVFSASVLPWLVELADLPYEAMCEVPADPDTRALARFLVENNSLRAVQGSA